MVTVALQKTSDPSPTPVANPCSISKSGVDAFLINGHHVVLRSAHEGDEDEVGAFYAALCNESCRMRFFTVRRHIAWAELHRTVSGQLPDHLTVLAHLDSDLVGIGEMHRSDDAQQAEVAFAVSDDHHGEGIATLLLEQLARTALDWRIRRFVAQTLHGNHAMQLVFRTVGCPVTIRRDDDVTEVAIELDAVALEEAAARRATIAEGAARLTAPGPTIR